MDLSVRLDVSHFGDTICLFQVRDRCHRSHSLYFPYMFFLKKKKALLPILNIFNQIIFTSYLTQIPSQASGT